MRDSAKNYTGTTLNNLLDIAEREGIIITYRHTGHPRGANYYMRGIKRIFLEESLKFNPSLHLHVLAHELGHHFTSQLGVSTLFSPENEVLQCEVDACKWACDFLCRELVGMQSGTTRTPEGVVVAQ